MSESYPIDDHRGERTLLVAASYVVLLDRSHLGERVLLQLRRNTGYMDGHWALLAGHVDAGETAFRAAVREAHEEAGVLIDEADLRPLTTQHRFEIGGPQVEQRVDFYFAAERWTGDPRAMEPDKCADMRWFRIDDLPDGLVPHEGEVLVGLRSGELPAITALPH